MNIKKTKTSPVGTIVFLVILSGVIIGLYIMLTRDNGKEETTEIPSELTEAETLIRKDLVKNYPATPREVLKIYCRITKCLYNDELTDEQIEKLVSKLRDLYYPDLLAINSEDQQVEAIKNEREKYKKDKKSIFDYWIDSTDNIEYIETKFGETAIINMSFTEQGSGMKKVYEKFSIVKDTDKKWKIAAFKEIKGESAITEAD